MSRKRGICTIKGAGMKMRISLCMIVKNEEKHIDECLKMIASLVDEIIIVDTGSSDKTKIIAQKYVEKIYDYEFHDDFAAARNYALRYATGDWVLALDADERLDSNNFLELKKELQQIKDKKIMALKIKKYNLFKNGGWYISEATKIFRNDKSIKYEGVINESTNRSIKISGGKIKNSRAYINHIGHMNDVIIRREKNRKYISIFEKKLLDNPIDLRIIGYLAILYRAEGEFEIAQALCNKGDSLKDSDNSIVFQLFSGHVYKGMGGLLEAKVRYQKAWTLSLNDPTILSNYGCILICMKQFQEAIEVLKEGVKKFPNEYYLYVNLGLGYQFSGLYEKALECFNIAEKGNPLLGCEHSDSKLEQDALYIYYLETIPHYAGLEYHKAFCEMKMRKGKY